MNLFLHFAMLALGAMLVTGTVRAQQICPGYPLTTPNSEFADAGNGTVRHIPTGLIWKRCAEGQVWDGTTCQGVAGSYTWQQAFQQADSVNAAGFAGQSDWRVPNLKELHSILERGCGNPSINLAQFPTATAPEFWSSSPFAANTDGAWGVGFGAGSDIPYGRSVANQVRLVRAGQYSYAFDAAAPATSTSVPTLSEWGVILLSAALGIVGWHVARRRREPDLG